MTDAQLAKLLALVATSLEERDATFSGGVIRMAVRRLQLLSRAPQASGETCPWCGGPVDQSGVGRPRIYCSTRCRNAATRKVRNGTMVETG